MSHPGTIKYNIEGILFMNNEDISVPAEQGELSQSCDEPMASAPAKKHTRPYRKIEDERRLCLLEMVILSLFTIFRLRTELAIFGKPVSPSVSITQARKR